MSKPEGGSIERKLYIDFLVLNIMIFESLTGTYKDGVFFDGMYNTFVLVQLALFSVIDGFSSDIHGVAF